MIKKKGGKEQKGKDEKQEVCRGVERKRQQRMNSEDKVLNLNVVHVEVIIIF